MVGQRVEGEMKVLVAAIATVSLTLWSTNDASANLVTNPSFEDFTGTFGGDGGRQLTSTSTTLTGWAIVGGEIAILKTPNLYSLTALDGTNFLDLSGYSNSGFPKGVSQTLTGLTPGQTYVVELNIGIRNGGCVGGGDNCHGPVEVTATAGGVTQTFTENSATQGNVWGSFGFDFKATGTSTVLSLVGKSVPLGNEYIGLDKISVNAIPEPDVGWIIGSGVVLLLGAMRKRGFAAANR
jgi:hypothetical protein